MLDMVAIGSELMPTRNLAINSESLKQEIKWLQKNPQASEKYQ